MSEEVVGAGFGNSGRALPTHCTMFVRPRPQPAVKFALLPRREPFIVDVQHGGGWPGRLRYAAHAPARLYVRPGHCERYQGSYQGVLVVKQKREYNKI